MTSSPNFYELVGGEPTFRKLVDEFYAGVADDPILRPLYPEEDLGPANERFRLFLIQYWGGPSHLLARPAATRGCGCGTRRSRSARRSATRGCGRCAGRSTRIALEPEAEAVLWEYLERAAHFMVNAPGDEPAHGIGQIVS